MQMPTPVGYPKGEQNPSYLAGPNSTKANRFKTAFGNYVQGYENSGKPYPKYYAFCNKVKIVKPKDMAMFKQAMRMIQSHMCMATAGHPGFLGYEILFQTGGCPAMRNWALDADILDQMSHFWINQYTYWRSYKDHENFHRLFEDVVRIVCGACGMMMVEGPIETAYAILDRTLPRPVSQSKYLEYLTNPDPNRRAKYIKGFAVDSGERAVLEMAFDVRPGHEQIFEKYITECFDNISKTGHCYGYMLQRDIGQSSAGSFAYNIKSMYWEAMDASGISQLEPNSKIWETFPMQARYVLRADFISVKALQENLHRVHTDRSILFPFALGVLDRAHDRPDVTVYTPSSFDHRYLDYANRTIQLVYGYQYNYQLDYAANLPFTPDLSDPKWAKFMGDLTMSNPVPTLPGSNPF